ncbi:hypothetical protein PIB30_041455 [Stylosanthes scabra]|uniref:DNA (cytosine-5-)-methyltransferase n=1 Tax=Stylosanthes scabra TaxID=79078 RepID=A0ABU6ZDN0_9FABA|nr:hypothetical protein [Stylosanthes scabra]
MWVQIVGCNFQIVNSSLRVSHTTALKLGVILGEAWVSVKQVTNPDAWSGPQNTSDWIDKNGLVHSRIISSFIDRPFARLWWDETVPTALTFPNCHNTKILHPEQDRVLSIREFARLQGFPDYYRFCGTVKQRYRQIGNAVAVPVGRALGYALGMAYLKKLSGNEALMTLPPKFSLSNYLQLSLKDQPDNTDTN